MKKTIFLVIILSLFLTGCNLKKNKEKILTLEEAKTSAANFINSNLMNQGKTADVKDVVEDNGLYKMTVKLPNGKEIISYMTRDGKKFFPEMMEIKESQVADNSNTQSSGGEDKTTKVSVKKDKPEVELFVMSYCPYGTQIEKGMLPVLETLGNKIDFKLKFCDYAMHGEKELDENLRQYCIEKNEPTKLPAYLKCFLKDGNYDSCLKENNVDSAKLESCVGETDKAFKVKEKFNDKNSWSGGNYPPFDVYKADNDKYGVQGSPTLIINGQEAQSGRDAASLLATICSAFNTQPEECQKQLSGAAPTAGFGFDGSGSNAAGGCGQ